MRWWYAVNERLFFIQEPCCTCDRDGDLQFPPDSRESRTWPIFIFHWPELIRETLSKFQISLLLTNRNTLNQSGKGIRINETYSWYFVLETFLSQFLRECITYSLRAMPETGKEQPDSNMNYAPGINSKSMHVFQSSPYSISRIHTVRHYSTTFELRISCVYASWIKKRKLESAIEGRRGVERDAPY